MVSKIVDKFCFKFVPTDFFSTVHGEHVRRKNGQFDVCWNAARMHWHLRFETVDNFPLATRRPKHTNHPHRHPQTQSSLDTGRVTCQYAQATIATVDFGSNSTEIGKQNQNIYRTARRQVLLELCGADIGGWHAREVGSNPRPSQWDNKPVGCEEWQDIHVIGEGKFIFSSFQF